jgi:hypothetical protein
VVDTSGFGQPLAEGLVETWMIEHLEYGLNK